MRLAVEKMVYGGEGLSRRDGEVILTPFVWPGEIVEVTPRPKRAGVLRAALDSIETPSPDRVAPACEYFGSCGGCHYQHAAYPAQLEVKRAILIETLQRLGKLDHVPDVEVISGEPFGYRNRVQVHFEGGAVGFREARSNRLVPIQHCPISSPKINEAIAALNRMVKLRAWPAFLKTAELFTNEEQLQFNVLESDRPIAQRFFDWCAEEMPGFESGALTYEGFKVSCGSFFQVNRFLTQALVDAVLSDVQGGGTALDLYAGVGLFSLPLTKMFDKVIAVESGSGAVRDLKANAATHAIELDARNMEVEDFLRTLRTPPQFVLADPPRGGLGKTVVTAITELVPREIALVACDPSSLARDAREICNAGYVLSRLKLIDLFPQTYHIEAVALFRMNKW